LRRSVLSPYYCCCHRFGWEMGMRRVVTRLEPAAAAATVVTALCNRTVVAGVAVLPCAMVVVVVAVHVISSEKKS
jgi:hypothetical protein